MLILAEIYNEKSTIYWKHGIFSLINCGGEYYWSPLHELHTYNNSEAKDFDISCTLRKTDEEICCIESNGYKYFGFKFKEADIEHICKNNY